MSLQPTPPLPDPSRPQAVKGAVTVIDQAPRCWHCGRRLAVYVGRPWEIRCRSCKSQNASPPGDRWTIG